MGFHHRMHNAGINPFGLLPWKLCNTLPSMLRSISFSFVIASNVALRLLMVNVHQYLIDYTYAGHYTCCPNWEHWPTALGLSHGFCCLWISLYALRSMLEWVSFYWMLWQVSFYCYGGLSFIHTFLLFVFQNIIYVYSDIHSILHIHSMHVR